MRKRMIDPDIWQDEKVAKLDLLGRLILVGIITIANDYGKMRGNAGYIKNNIMPFDKTPLSDIEKSIKTIYKLGIVLCYEINNERFIKLKNWDKYQTLHHPAKDTIPEPPTNIGNLPDNMGNLPAQDKISKDKIREEKEREVKDLKTPAYALNNKQMQKTQKERDEITKKSREYQEKELKKKY